MWRHWRVVLLSNLSYLKWGNPPHGSICFFWDKTATYNLPRIFVDRATEQAKLLSSWEGVILSSRNRESSQERDKSNLFRPFCICDPPLHTEVVSLCTRIRRRWRNIITMCSQREMLKEEKDRPNLGQKMKYLIRYGMHIKRKCKIPKIPNS